MEWSDNIRQSDWIRAIPKLGLDLVKNNKGTSHTYIVRDPKNKDMDDVRGLIAVLQVNLYKQANRSIFNNILDFGVEEEKIWKALGML
ncbi:MAG: hypothetical protein WCX27_03215 [Candidatus Paceibacterota bacterium]|jgi:hypothetical protein